MPLVMHGIGKISDVTSRRRLPEAAVRSINDKAKGELLGYSLDENGAEVHSTSDVGLRLCDVANANHVIAVAAGEEKSEATLAALATGLITALVVDEALARGIAERA